MQFATKPYDINHSVDLRQLLISSYNYCLILVKLRPDTFLNTLNVVLYCIV